MQPISGGLSPQSLNAIYAASPGLQPFVEAELRTEKQECLRQARGDGRLGVRLAGFDAEQYQPRTVDQILMTARRKFDEHQEWLASVEGRLTHKLGDIHVKVDALAHTYEMAVSDKSRGLAHQPNRDAFQRRLDEMVAAARLITVLCATAADDLANMPAVQQAAA